MSVVVKEFRCLVHGEFEGKEAICPEGCDTVQRIFLTPPGFASAKTKNIDATLESLAKSHGLTDMSNRGGRAVRSQSGAQEQSNEAFAKLIRERYGDGWGHVPPGAALNVKTGKIEAVEGRASGPGAPGALAQYHGRADNVLADESVAQALAVKKPILIKKDPENLKVTDARPPA